MSDDQFVPGVTSADEHNDLSPRAYEQAVAERFRTIFPRPAFEVRHDIRLPGRASAVRRQVDIAIYEANGSVPILLVEVKRHKRAVDLVTSGATVALIRDIGAAPAVMVSTAGFSRAAKSQLLWEGIKHMTISPTEAKGLRWIPHIEQWFGLDRWFRETTGVLFEAMRVRNMTPFLDTDIPYEEWVATIQSGLDLFPKQAVALLRNLARSHVDDGVRFNAVQMLIDCDELAQADAADLLAAEIDEEVQSLLLETLDRQD